MPNKKEYASKQRGCESLLDGVFKKTLVAGFVSVLMSPIAMAQDASENDKSYEEIEEVVVVGIKNSLRQATELKRTAANVIDAITAEDVGKFPDQNVAESLQRITGVQISRLRGEGQRASIRGLPTAFADVTLNGVSVPNALRSVFFNVEAPSRSFDYTILPSEFIRTLEVNKSSIASLPSGGLAGTINVKTPRPFDFDGRALTFSAKVTNDSNSDDYEPQFAALYSDTFNDGRFGITAGITHSTRSIVTEGVRNFAFANAFTERNGFANGQEIGAFTGDGSNAALNASTCNGTVASRPSCFGQDFNGDGVLTEGQSFEIPTTIYDYLVEERERTSGLLSLQFQATDNVQLYADVLYSELDIENQQLEGLFLQSLSVGPFLPQQSTVQSFDNIQNVITTFAANNTDYRNNNRIERREGDLSVVTLGAKWESGDWTADAQITASESTQTGDALSLVNVTYVDVVQQFGNDIPQTTFLNGSEARITTDRNASRFGNINGQFNQRAERDLTDIQIDISKDIDGLFNKVSFGVQYSDRSLFVNDPRLNAIPVSGIVSLLGAQNPSLFNEALGFTGTQSAENFLLTADVGSGAFLDGNFPAARLFADTGILFRNFSNAELLAQSTGINPNSNQTQDIEEQILDIYVGADFSSDDGRLSGNIGLRISDTDLTSTGVGVDLNTIQLTPGLNTQVVTLSNFEADGSYTEVLPSLNLRYELNDNLVLRAAASRTLARPTLSALSPTTAPNVLSSNITGGNPGLDPFIADNFDFGVEYYWGDSNLLSATYFTKDIVSLLVPGNTTQTLPVVFQATGEIRNVTFTNATQSNGPGSQVDGFEIGYQQTFENLPGFLSNVGINANYTLVDAEDPTVLPGSSKHNYNLGAFYEDDTFSARLTYTFRDDFVSEVGFFRPGVNTINESFDTLDGSFQVTLGNYTVFLEGNNLLDEAVSQNYDIGLSRQYTESGRRLALGVRGKF